MTIVESEPRRTRRRESSPRVSTPPVRGTGRGRRALAGARAWLYLLPAVAIYAFIVLIPTAQSVWFSLFSWNGVSPAEWVGLGNYLAFLSDPLIGQALGHTLVLVAFFSLLPISLGLLSAALVSRARLRGASFFRSIIFVPQVLTSVVIVVAWRQMYSSEGLVNSSLRAVGLDALAQPWLGSFEFALPALGLVGTWTMMGLCMILFLAGVGNIPTELYDAARVDGAGAVREFWAVTLPGLRPQLTVALTLTLIGALRAFDLIWLTTRGGPGTSTITPAVLLYSSAFTQQTIGKAAAIGVCLAVLALGIAWSAIRLIERRDR
ncbi:carbohydrate ABC transporter permease [Microbacterium sp. p3-SID336]|uniref:carbohydrate ABC transporter permease n=1 Tax=Microbacterium sp. p3-SID336 TaxID=2916212 RepID=UPI0021A59BA4|nr:sugar ABC transporter permease [Microbacterium sp. p3-SID336]MCT1478875.1 sugar ABC transporter permease [Microbacterium sp. p3-SID336]